jgi:hypothetical protein
MHFRCRLLVCKSPPQSTAVATPLPLTCRPDVSSVLVACQLLPSGWQPDLALLFVCLFVCLAPALFTPLGSAPSNIGILPAEQHQKLSGLGLQTPASVRVPQQLLQVHRTAEGAQRLVDQQKKHSSSASSGDDSSLGAASSSSHELRQRGHLLPDSPTSSAPVFPAKGSFSLGPRYSSQSVLHAGAGARAGADGDRTVALPRSEQSKGMAQQITTPLPTGSSASSADIQLHQLRQPTVSSGASRGFREFPREFAPIDSFCSKVSASHVLVSRHDAL